MSNNRLQFYRLWLGLGWLLIAIIFYLSLGHVSLEPRIGFPIDKVEHFSAYATLMWWFSQIYLQTRQRMWLAVAFILMGIIIEILQGMTGYRDMEAMDAVADSLGVFFGWWLANTRLGHILASLDRELRTRQAR